MNPAVSDLMWRIVWITAAGLAALLAAFIVGRLIRRNLSASSQQPAFTIQDLREMRDAGQISEREYQAMRAAIIGQAAPSSEPPPPIEQPVDDNDRQQPPETDQEA